MAEQEIAAAAEANDTATLLSVAEDAMNDFKAFRLDASRLSRQLSDQERARTQLRQKLVEDLIASGTSKTAATDQARLSPEYVKASQAIETTTQAWEDAMTGAEHARMKFQLLDQASKQVYDCQRALAELRVMEDIVKKRLRSLGAGG